eukprot:8755271-Pyramimonas_sp.AAC.1
MASTRVPPVEHRTRFGSCRGGTPSWPLQARRHVAGRSKPLAFGGTCQSAGTIVPGCAGESVPAGWLDGGAP